ncbi:MAG: MlaD family protein [Phycisphaerales bacterium]
MSMRAVNQNNVLAGSFVIAGVLLAVLMSFVLGDLAGNLGSKTSYVVRFPTNVGVLGLEKGAEVTFAGMKVGSVSSVSMVYRQDEASGQQVAQAMDVEIELPSDLVIFEDAIADLTPPLLGGVSRINIASAGSGAVGPDDPRSSWAADADGVLGAGEVMQGQFAPSLLQQMGLGSEELAKIRGVIDQLPVWSQQVTAMADNGREITESARRMVVDDLEPKFGDGVDDGKSTLSNVRSFTDRLNAEGDWQPRVDSILASADDGAKQFKGTLDDARGAMSSAVQIMDENRGKIARTMDNVEGVTERVRFESIDKMNDVLNQGALAVGSAKDAIGDIRGLVGENRSHINATLVNARQLSLSGKLFLDEVRSQPWRLLNKPSKADLKREPLYEAARGYALAVSELRSASESLDSAVRMSGEQSGSTSEEFAAELLRLAAVVDQAYGRYEQAEQGLLEKLAESP